jgi:hypothetical protein
MFMAGTQTRTSPATPDQAVASSPHSVTYTVMDGSSVQVTSSVALGPASTYVTAQLLQLGLSYVHLVAGPLGLPASLAASREIVEDMQFHEEYSLQGGRLRLGSGDQPVGPDGARYGEIGPDGHGRPSRVHMAVWYGEAFSLHAIRYGGERQMLLAMFDQFRIVEQADGISCVPKDRSSTFFIEGPGVIINVPGFGILESVRLTRAVARNLPRYEGTRVAGGELFVNNLRRPDMFFVLVGETSRTTLMPHHGVSESNVLDGLANLAVAWRHPS